jgi:hypothetical protein
MGEMVDDHKANQATKPLGREKKKKMKNKKFKIHQFWNSGIAGLVFCYSFSVQSCLCVSPSSDGPSGKLVEWFSGRTCRAGASSTRGSRILAGWWMLLSHAKLLPVPVGQGFSHSTWSWSTASPEGQGA